MTYIKDKLYPKETLGTEGSEKAVQMAELWTHILDHIQPLYQQLDQHFEAITGHKMIKWGKGSVNCWDHTLVI